MVDTTGEVQRALLGIDARWDADRTETSLRGLHRKRARRAATRAAAVALVLVALAVGVYSWSERMATGLAENDDGPGSSGAVADPGDDRPGDSASGALAEVVIDERAVAAPEVGAQVEVVESAPERARVRVVRGKSRFRVARKDRRAVEVAAGAVRIEVFASEFSVAHYGKDTEVWAHSGAVAIEWRGQTYELDPGQSRRFAADGGKSREDGADDGNGDGRRARGSWRDLAEQGDFAAAYRALDDGQRVRKRVPALMLAADVYRSTGRPRRAAGMLQRVIDSFPGDPRAPLAAFTLGRIWLDDLDRPARAARTFARARKLAPRGALAEDALAREVEAWSRAGHSERARDRAERYLDLYPDGHRVRAVEKFGGL
ncbi:MAG: tetratricopeptide repeat protein [Myxococcota bacterium]